MNTININIPLVSYSLGGMFYLGLAVLLMFGWRGRGLYILLAVSFNAFWAFALAYLVTQTGFSFATTYWLEIVRYGFWLTFMLSLLGGGMSIELRNNTWLIIIAFVLLASFMAGFMIDTVSQVSLPIWPLMSLLILSIIGIALIEQFYRNTPLDKRWAVKFLCISLGGLFAYDFYMYTHGLLFRQVDLVIWTARGAVNALLVPFIALSVARNPEWSFRIFVSRHIIFYSASIVASGFYLLAMALGGYYIRAYGGSWGEFLQLVLVCGAGIFLLVLIMSAQIRSNIKRFLGEHFFSNKYDYRREWLRLIDILASPEQGISLQQRTVKAVTQIVQARGGVMWFRYGRDYYVPVAAWNHDLPVDAMLNHQNGMVEYLQGRQKIIDFSNANNDESMKSIKLDAWVGQMENLWLVIPLFHGEELLGFIVLARTDYSPKITWEDEDLLKTVGQQLSSYLLQEEAAAKLAETQQFDAYNQLTAFIIHDLKNLISQLALVVQNAATHKNNPAFIEDAIETIDNAVGYMGRLIEQLKSGETGKNNKLANLNELLKAVVQQCSNRQPAPQLHEPERDLMLRVDHERLAMMIKHLVNNAQDATKSSGFVKVSANLDNGYAVINVEDNGIGMDKDFIDHRLFKPFDSTKGAKGMGIGVYEVKEFVRSNGGEIFVKSFPGEGALFTLLLPVHS